MKNIKKLFSLFLLLIIVLTLTGCNVSADKRFELIEYLQKKNLVETKLEYVDTEYHTNSPIPTQSISDIYKDKSNNYYSFDISKIKANKRHTKKYSISYCNHVIKNDNVTIISMEEAEVTSDWYYKNADINTIERMYINDCQFKTFYILEKKVLGFTTYKVLNK